MKAGIAGGGIMGKLLAFTLANAGWNVTLFDNNSPNCSMAAAGLLSPIADLEKSDPVVFHLGIEGLNNHWPNILSILNSSIYFKKQGSLCVSHSKDAAELSRLFRIISSKIASHEMIQFLNEEDIFLLEPELKNFSSGYFFSIEGQIDNQLFLTVLSEYLNKIGVKLKHETFTAMTQPDFDFVFDCRGLGAKSIFKKLRGIRGELIWVYAPMVNISRPVRLQHPRYHLYIAPRPDHIYILGATEIESEDGSEISVQSMLELLSAAYSIHPGFSEARILKSYTHCRPTLPDHLPKIQYADGFLAINGLYRHGFLIAPSIAEDIFRYLTKGISHVRYPSLWEEYHDTYSIQ